MTRHMAIVKNCVCVDLDSDFFYLMQSYAERSGTLALFNCRGEEAIARIREEQPAVVFLEADTPGGMLVWNVLKELKSSPITRGIPVVFFSWIQREEQALEEGADIYVQKPVMYANFLEALAVAGIGFDAHSSEASDEKGGGLPYPES